MLYFMWVRAPSRSEELWKLIYRKAITEGVIHDGRPWEVTALFRDIRNVALVNRLAKGCDVEVWEMVIDTFPDELRGCGFRGLYDLLVGGSYWGGSYKGEARETYDLVWDHFNACSKRQISTLLLPKDVQDD